MKMGDKMKNKNKLPVRIKVNIGIFMVIAVMFAVMPQIMMRVRAEQMNSIEQPQYAGQFVYVLHDICPCRADDEECAGYYACGPDKANIKYNLDTVPEELLDAAKRDHYFEGMIEADRQGSMIMRDYLQYDICYLMAFVSLIAGVIYWNHCKARFGRN